MAYEDQVFATFYDDALPNKRQTKLTGTPVFDDCLMIKIQIPNQHDCVPRPVQDKDKVRFPKSWEAYQTGKEAAVSGYPVEEWTRLTVSELKVLQACQVKTVEQLAELPDSGLHRLGIGAMEMKMRAQRFIEEGASGPELKEKNDLLQNRIEELEATVEDLLKRVEDSLIATPKTKRKRHKVAA